MKYTLIIVLVLSAFLSSCKSPASLHKFEKSQIVMKKTECYGTCPVYKITLLGTGKAMYEGIKHVKKVGKFEKQLSAQETEKIFTAFEASNFTDFKEIYTEPVTDVSTTFITFVHRGFSKTIEDYYNAPQELKKLEKMVEEVANSEGWELANSE
jgi:hypothetical protein